MKNPLALQCANPLAMSTIFVFYLLFLSHTFIFLSHGTRQDIDTDDECDHDCSKTTYQNNWEVSNEDIDMVGVLKKLQTTLLLKQQDHIIIS